MTHFSFKLKVCWWSNLKYISTNFFGITDVVVFWRNHLGWANFTHPLPTLGITINNQIHVSMYIWHKYINFSCHDELSTKICIHGKMTFDFKYVFCFFQNFDWWFCLKTICVCIYHEKVVFQSNFHKRCMDTTRGVAWGRNHCRPGKRGPKLAKPL